jgi:hypothetical protein
MHWWLMAFSYGRAVSKIIIHLLRRPNRVLLSAQSLNHMCLLDVAGLNFLTKVCILLDHDKEIFENHVIS